MEAKNNTIAPAQARGYFTAFFDRIASRLLGFPPERCSYTAQTVRIPILEGLSRIVLEADLFQPVLLNGSKPLGTVLIRTPYGRGLLIGPGCRAFAARGYNVLLVSCRGTFGSTGEFDPFRTEVEDGKGVVEWMRKQDWYTGTFATFGGSYLGFVQWALLCDPPKDMVAAVPMVAPHNYGPTQWGTGALKLDKIGWSHNISMQEDRFFLWNAFFAERKLKPILESIPLTQGVRAYYGEKIPWLDNFVTKSDLSDPYYAPMDFSRALERAQIPILIVTGWYDIFLEQTIEQYTRLKEKGCEVAMTIGPWEHIKAAVGPEANRLGFDWIEEHLGKGDQVKREKGVRYFVSGAAEWKSIISYPPPTTPRTLYLRDGGRLGSQPSATGIASSRFIFDPHNPMPMIGGNNIKDGGSKDDTALATRSDVLAFDTEPLEEDLEFCGRPVIELVHSTDIPYADLFVRISEVDQKGKSRNITETYQRLDPKRDPNKVIKLALNECAHRFVKGKRIRLLISGGCFPLYARNIGTENSDNRGGDVCAVEHTVHHDVTQVSKIIFPVVVSGSE